MTSRPPQVFTSYLMLSLLRFASICFDLLRFASICFDLEKGTIVTKFVVSAENFGARYFRTGEIHFFFFGESQSSNAFFTTNFLT